MSENHIPKLKNSNSDDNPRSTFIRGSDSRMVTIRSKMQSERFVINKKMTKQLRLRAGAENLFNASTNMKVKESVALELSYLNSNLQLLKEELSLINSKVQPYQSKSGKVVNIPLIPLGLKETTEVNWIPFLEERISVHYGENTDNYTDEILDLQDLRNSIKNPFRNEEGILALLRYYNQLYFVESRFHFSTKFFPRVLYFHWYDSLTGIPSVQKSFSLEKACVLFNVGSLYSQLACKCDRSDKSKIQAAIVYLQRSAGAFNYLRFNFSNAPTHDLTHNFLSCITKLMLAQAQECVYELEVFGGFEVELKKCIHLAGESKKVSVKYKYTLMDMQSELSSFLPDMWSVICEVKSIYYDAVAHYYTAMGLLKQSDEAEVQEISNLLSTLYVSDPAHLKKQKKITKSEDKKRLGKAHLKEAAKLHEISLNTYNLYDSNKESTTDVLKQYLQHSYKRCKNRLDEYKDEYDFFELSEAPSIQAKTEVDSECVSPDFTSAPVKDIFKKMGPIGIFSSKMKLGAHRYFDFKKLSIDPTFHLKGDAPVRIHNVGEKLKEKGVCENDVIIEICGEDVRWESCSKVKEIIDASSNLTMKLIATLGTIHAASPTAGFGHHQPPESYLLKGEVINQQQLTLPVRMRQQNNNNNLENSRSSLGSLPKMKKSNPFSSLVGRNRNKTKRSSLLGSLKKSGSQILFGSKSALNGTAF